MSNNCNMIHSLKIHLLPFRDVMTGIKKAEIRRLDRPFKVGDFLELNEIDPVDESPTGERGFFRITHILRGGQYGIDPGYGMLSIEPVSRSEQRSAYAFLPMK